MTSATGLAAERRMGAIGPIGAGPSTHTRTQVRALVVHRSDLVRAGIAALLQEGGIADSVVAVPSVYEAFRLATATPPTVIFFDYAGRDGAEAARLLGGLWPRPHLVALAPDERSSRPGEAIASGASAVIAVDQVTRDMFLGGVRSVLAGLVPLLIGFTSGGPSSAADEAAPTDILTRREREMLYLIGEGLTNREIAETLVLSVKTVETHRANLSRKLNIRSRAGLMRLAVTGGVGVAGSAA
jgi:DNA-binding NarL/FixJ family response regulator